MIDLEADFLVRITLKPMTSIIVFPKRKMQKKLEPGIDKWTEATVAP